jgi:hypothetical protein
MHCAANLSSAFAACSARSSLAISVRVRVRVVPSSTLGLASSEHVFQFRHALLEVANLDCSKHDVAYVG